MTEKTGRNDPCPCGSGKKFKQCCLNLKSGKKKLAAKWLNAPSGPNLIERTFGAAISATNKKPPSALKETESPTVSEEIGNNRTDSQ